MHVWWVQLHEPMGFNKCLTKGSLLLTRLYPLEFSLLRLRKLSLLIFSFLLLLLYVLIFLVILGSKHAKLGFLPQRTTRLVLWFGGSIHYMCLFFLAKCQNTKITEHVSTHVLIFSGNGSTTNHIRAYFCHKLPIHA